MNDNDTVDDARRREILAAAVKAIDPLGQVHDACARVVPDVTAQEIVTALDDALEIDAKPPAPKRRAKRRR